VPESRLYTFLDAPGQFALYFLEGQRLIRDLALATEVCGPAFAYFRDAVLSVQPMIALIKRGEQLGFYLDSNEPRFRLKIETGHHGDTRCALVPADLREFPARVWGVARLLKLFVNGRAPYESILHVDGEPLRDIVNRVLDNSYQVRCAVSVAETSDQSVMLHELPPIAGREHWEMSEAVVERRAREVAAAIGELFDRALSDPAEIRDSFAGLGFRHLADRPIRLRCSCSRERMISNIRSIRNVRTEELFDPGQEYLEVICEYCRAHYAISRGDVRAGAAGPH